jgi:manganese efflux pump family protein
MTLSAILTLAVGLAMDATAVAAALGLAAKRIRVRDVAGVAGLFGGFQALMPMLGWGVGHYAGPWLQAFQHWIAFGLLTALGGKMLWEALRRGPGPGDRQTARSPFALISLVGLALATSIDALLVGVTLPMLQAPFWLSIASIGCVTALLSAAGVLAGRRLGAALGPRLELAGGVVLIALGIRFLLES